MTAPAEATLQVVTAPHDTLLRDAARRFVHHRLAVLGATMLALVFLIAIVGPFLLPDPYFISLTAFTLPPDAAHILGTDLSGRDVAARVATGARTSLIVGFGAVAVYVAIGLTIGLVAGFLGRASIGVEFRVPGTRHRVSLKISIDQLLMRFTDIIMSIPTLLLIIVFVSVVGPSLESVIAIIGLLGWPPTARILRGQVLALRDSEYVTAARVGGASDWSILIRHVLPNIFGPLTVLATFGVAQAILREATLSFLGLGVQPPQPSLGNMIYEAQDSNVLLQVPWLWLSPGIVIALTVLAVNFVGDGLRDALDPRSSRRR